jgi:uncharacterized SAM-binding protein YcdF (DUF218 family)
MKPLDRFFTRKKFRVLIGFVSALFLFQILYYIWVFKTLAVIPPPADLVLIYSGGDDRETAARNWRGQAMPPLFLFSGWEYKREDLRRSTGLPDSRFLVEDRAKTTDQNIRYSLPLIQRSGAQKLILALPWYHLPRALFLTRLYLMGTGDSVIAYATLPLPAGWWKAWDFWREIIKFWGSLFRITLSWIGIENWPPHVGN